jgi:hypothetical protein
MTIRSIEILWEPLTILGSFIVTFYGFSWVLEKFARLIGFRDEEEEE